MKTLRLIVLYFAISTAFFASTAKASSSVRMEGDVPKHISLLYSDLVVQGILTDVRTDPVPAIQFDPSWPPPAEGQFVHVSRATIRITKVLKGSFDKAVIVLVAEEDDALPRELIGTDVIVPANFQATVLGGSYMSPRHGMCYAKKDDGWVLGDTRSTDDEIRSAIASTRVENIRARADLIVTGVVDSVSESILQSPVHTSMEIQQLKFRVEEVKKGSVHSADVITIRAVTKGTYWPVWRSIVSHNTKSGDRLYVFLKRNDDAYNIVGGVNGCFKIRNQQLIYNDWMNLDYSKDDLDRMVRSGREANND